MTSRSERSASTLTNAVRRSRMRLSPFLALMFAISILDRSNVGFARNALKVDANIGDASFALGAGIFFISYALFGLPSNLILHRVGAKFWLCCIMVTWGIASALMMFVHGDLSFYALRFLVGATEAGFSPGVVLYITYWFPSRDRGKALGIYYIGLPAALILGSILSGYLMQATGGQLGLRNWQWMFLVEGLMASLVGIIAYFYIPSKPHDAPWLSQAECREIESALAEEEIKKDRGGNAPSTFKTSRVISLIAIYFAVQVNIYVVIFYLPSRVAEVVGSQVNSEVGFFVALPWLCALLSLHLVTGFADKKGWHRQSAAAMLLVAAFGMAASTLVTGMTATMIAFSAAAVGLIVVQPLFWTLPTSYLKGAKAAGGIAVISTIGNLGGFAAPTLKTAAELHFHSQKAGSLVLAVFAIFGSLLLFCMERKATPSNSLPTEVRLDA
jgi:MFS family permease